MKRKKIAVVTGSRADYGLLKGIIGLVDRDPALTLQLMVTGSHLLQRFGYTAGEIKKDGFKITAKIHVLSAGDSAFDTADAISKGVRGFASAYKKFPPDIIVLLGDRFEVFAASIAAVPFRIPIAHIHGGEITEGAFDEQFRHAITKLSHLHFCATEEHRKRIIRMGEAPERVSRCGAPGLDNIRSIRYLDRMSLAKKLGIPEDMKLGVVTYHPETIEGTKKDVKTVRALLGSLVAAEKIFWVITSPNADPGNIRISRRIIDFTRRHPGRAKSFDSLGSTVYLSLLKHASVMVGNSSSGVIEAPSFCLPVVNVGNRQGLRGKNAARNVINVRTVTVEAVSKAIRRAMDPRFRRGLRGLKNPFGDGRAGEEIVRKLKSIRLDGKLLKKEFHDP